jgi:heteromeric Ino2p/Ino4p transcription factor
MSQIKEKPRLTEQEKKNNHIASEQKRRQAIREGFDRLCTIVPNMAGQGRSESLVLTATLDYMKEQMAEYEKLMTEATKLGIDISDIKIKGVPPFESEQSTSPPV